MQENIKNNKCECMDYCFSTLEPKQFALISGILGVIISDDLSVNEKNALGNFIVNLGQAILTEAAQQQVQENKINMEMRKEIDELKRKIELLKYE
ncbi:hypothetical protein [Anaerosacchariphilus polymeriproducens]|uniref:Uncharacterized protein n=1 Tax=Anaerosacchariphilus polymeriproducens TaxID=1812858 RepID=A0A371AZ90_9FIRM|nr:hypothetical protein [Anaerosacchariphilus polymeriproducens]RDU24915.1 hypothetical protein DWV06_01415 [Anaerosacchariphilus polymeriproducens]